MDDSMANAGEWPSDLFEAGRPTEGGAERRARLQRMTIRCSAAMEAAVARVGAGSGRSVSQVVATTFALLPPTVLETLPDFEEPTGRLRRSAGRIRLSVASQWDRPTVRRVLGFIAGISQGERVVKSTTEERDLRRDLESAQGRVRQLMDFIARISFAVLPQGIVTKEDARYVLGLTPTAPTDAATVSERFRQLAAVYHPDMGLPGSHDRMIQLTAARRYFARWG
jgi:hypothetical protein